MKKRGRDYNENWTGLRKNPRPNERKKRVISLHFGGWAQENNVCVVEGVRRKVCVLGWGDKQELKKE